MSNNLNEQLSEMKSWSGRLDEVSKGLATKAHNLRYKDFNQAKDDNDEAAVYKHGSQMTAFANHISPAIAQEAAKLNGKVMDTEAGYMQIGFSANSTPENYSQADLVISIKDDGTYRVIQGNIGLMPKPFVRALPRFIQKVQADMAQPVNKPKVAPAQPVVEPEPAQQEPEVTTQPKKQGFFGKLRSAFNENEIPGQLQAMNEVAKKLGLKDFMKEGLAVDNGGGLSDLVGTTLRHKRSGAVVQIIKDESTKLVAKILTGGESVDVGGEVVITPDQVATEYEKVDASPEQKRSLDIIATHEPTTTDHRKAFGDMANMYQVNQ